MNQHTMGGRRLTDEEQRDLESARRIAARTDIPMALRQLAGIDAIMMLTDRGRLSSILNPGD